MNYRQMVQHVCRKYGMPVPVTVIGNIEPTYAIFNALVVEAADYIVDQLQPFLRTRRTATIVSGTDQGPITTIFGPGMDRLVPGTLWNNTKRRPFIGPLSPQDWQLTQANPTAAAGTYFTIMENRLLVWPAPTGGDQMSAIIQTKAVFQPTTGPAVEYPGADTDAFLLTDAILRLQLEWRWLRSRERPFADIKQEAEMVLNDEVNKLGAAPRLNLSPEVPQVKPGIWIPVGGWNV